MVSAPEDAASRAAELSSRVGAATARVLATAAQISDDQAHQPSPLPGWTRGHVLTHLARNADGLANLLIWARTGIVTPQYSSAEIRDEQIEAGAGRPAAVLSADVAESAMTFAAEAARLTDADWNAEVRGIRGAGHPAWYTLWRRLSELEIHHVDLDAGYRPVDWPADFVGDCLPLVADAFSGDRCQAALLRTAGDGGEYRIGPPADAPAVTVTGPSRSLLAWLLGRASDRALAVEPPGPLPAVPPW